MFTPDESILSAYLDGELEPRQVRKVERAIAANPVVSEMLDDLRAVRAMVSGLSRPSSPDLAPDVLASLPLRSPGRSERLFTRRVMTYAAAGVSAAAALLLAWLPLHQAGPAVALRPGAIPGVLKPIPHPEAPSIVDASAKDSPVVADRDPTRGDGSSIPAGRTDVPAGVAEPRLANVDGDDAETARVHRLLDDPQLHRVFLVTDRVDRSLEPEVASLVERTTRQDYLKFTVAQGIVIDPKHPGKATVFAMVLDHSELDAFRSRLQNELGGQVTESEIRPFIPVQLADIGQVVSLRPDPRGDVSSPAARNLAVRRENPDPQGQPESEVAPNVTNVDDLKARLRSRPGIESVTITERPRVPHPPAVDTAVAKNHDNKQQGDAIPSVPARHHERPGTGDTPASIASNRTVGRPTTGSSTPRPSEARCVVLVWVSTPVVR